MNHSHHYGDGAKSTEVPYYKVIHSYVFIYEKAFVNLLCRFQAGIDFLVHTSDLRGSLHQCCKVGGEAIAKPDSMER